jgi:hypothetical protein
MTSPVIEGRRGRLGILGLSEAWAREEHWGEILRHVQASADDKGVAVDLESAVWEGGFAMEGMTMDPPAGCLWFTIYEQVNAA